ncbi:MAG: thiolase [Pseudomonadota bacterium]|nr:thiolase [Pseudomonadota bacterium]
MKHERIVVVGAAETSEMGKIPNLSQVQLHADAALNALDDAGLKASDIDGIATAGESPITIAQYLGIQPEWIDGTSVGGCSFMMHVRHCVGAIAAGMCKTVLITHGESGKSRVPPPAWPWPPRPGSYEGQFEAPFGTMGPPDLLTMPVLRYLKDFNVPIEDLAMVSVIQREWASLNPRAWFKEPITVEEVLGSKMIAYPFTLLMCCPRTDGGGAIVITSEERAKDLRGQEVYILGTGESGETMLISQMEDFTSSRAFRVSATRAFKEAGIKRADVDHLMLYDAFAHLPIFALEDLGFCEKGQAPGFIRNRNTAPGGKLPVNTNGGGLSYMHSGMYGMYAMQESIRQVRGTAAAQVSNVNISVAHGIGGMFSASGTVIFSKSPI